MLAIKNQFTNRRPDIGPLPGRVFAGYFFGEYRTEIRTYHGPDYGRKCFIFAGQGAVKPGMMKAFYDDHALFRQRFDLADELARRYQRPAPSDYILNPKRIPTEHHTVTRILCLLTAEIALYELLRAHHQTPAMLSAHSFGEQPALVAAGVFTFEQMFEIVHQRECVSPKENKLGYLMVVYTDPVSIAHGLADLPYHVANVNAPLETVIAVAPEQLSIARKILKHKGIKSNPLRSVPQPYHSPAMQGVSDAMAEFLARTELACQPPTVPLYSGVTHKLLSSDHFTPQDAYDIIVNLSSTPIDFIRQVKTLYELGLMHYIEIGPRTVCATFVRDILHDATVTSRFTGYYLETKKKTRASEPLDRKSQSFLASINRIIGKVTGYEIESLSIDDNFQEELGIDSIKKAEIIVTVLDELKINAVSKLDTVDFETIGDTVDYLKHAEQTPDAAPTSGLRCQTAFARHVERWVAQPLEPIFAQTESAPLVLTVIPLEAILSDREGVLATLGKASDQNVVLLAEPDSLAAEAFGNEDVETHLRRELYPLIGFFQMLPQAIAALPCTLFLVSRGTPQPILRALNGLIKSLCKETEQLVYKFLQVERTLSDEALSDYLHTERDAPDIDVRYIEGRREVLQLVMEELSPASESLPIVADGAVVVVLGGAKGITYSLIEQLNRECSVVLYIAGRSDDTDPIVHNHLTQLKETNPQVHYSSLDATRYDELDAFVGAVHQRHDGIDLLINGTGTLAIDRLADKTLEAIDHELLNKVLPACHSMRAAQRYGIRRTIQFSSVLARYGGVGQSIYSAANALIDALTAQYNATTEHRSALSINWPPWDETGMTANPGVLTKLKEFGMALLMPTEAYHFFTAELAGQHTENVYYFDRTDSPLYASTPADSRRYDQLLGHPLGGREALTFEKIFTLETDAYLSQHTIRSVPCVPAAVAIAMFYGLSRCHFDAVPVLETFEAHNPLLVNDRVETRLTSQTMDLGLALVLESSLTHFTATARKAGVSDKMAIALPKAVAELDLGSFYAGAEAGTDGVYHGPKFQMLQNAALDNADSLVAQLNNPGLSDILNNPAYSRLALWIDGGFQALGLLIMKRYGFQSLPTKVGRLMLLDQPLSPTLFIRAQLSAVDSDKVGARGDILICNARGAPVLSMTAVAMARFGLANHTSSYK